jgi:hypothetical protein
VAVTAPLLLSQCQLRALDDEAAFRRTLSSPVLVWTPPEKEPATGLMFATRDLSGSKRPAAGEPRVFEVARSSSSGGFALGISVGRAESNDVWLDDQSVSRFHAWFQKGSGPDDWLLCDAESRNGSWIGEQRLAPHRATPLPFGTRIRFGDLELEFYLPDAFVAFLRGRRSR